MMQDEQNKWVDEVMNSLQGIRAAEPPTDLFASITARINHPEAKVVPMRQLRWSIAIAAMLLLLNAMAIRSYAINQNDGYAQAESYEAFQLGSDYKIYE